MSLTPISKISFDIQNQPGWEGVREWGIVVRTWAEIVSPTVAARSRPKSLSRDMLTIATDGASLAHQLTFNRRTLCQKLNARLPIAIADLRFAPLGQIGQTALTATPNDEIAIDSGDIVICERCECRARQGELLRWDVCQYCAIDLGIVGGRLSPKM